jgi:hypothetical protein
MLIKRLKEIRLLFKTLKLCLIMLHHNEECSGIENINSVDGLSHCDNGSNVSMSMSTSLRSLKKTN